MKKTPRAKLMRFAQEYVIDLNAREAAIRAGYAPSSAHTHARRLLAKDEVQAEIARLQAERAERAKISADDALREVAQIAMADVQKPPLMSDKLKALDMLMRHLGLFQKDQEQKGSIGMAQLAAAILGNVAGAGGVSVPEDDAA